MEDCLVMEDSVTSVMEDYVMSWRTMISLLAMSFVKTSNTRDPKLGYV